MTRKLTKKEVESQTRSENYKLSDEDRENIIAELEALIAFRKLTAESKAEPIIDFNPSSSIMKFF